MELPASERAQRAPLLFVIKLQGEFDLADNERVRQAFSIPKTAERVVVDFQNASYIDSTILQRLIELREETLKRGANLTLVGMIPGVRRILEVSSLEPLFQFDGSVADVRRAQPFDNVNVRTLTLVSGTAPAR